MSHTSTPRLPVQFRKPFFTFVWSLPGCPESPIAQMRVGRDVPGAGAVWNV
jgi:hypothetical protein